ncbi:MAG TPA: hypothetical protein PLE74_01505 [Candidatus Cloacimonadota bacterium]|nr:hypothetical protein [Candidatus Cloacimonadota bacterium]HPT70941.1 hypothetical protein [Candidatus Cloacimonadota bacterium]
MALSTKHVSGLVLILFCMIIPAWAGNSIFSFDGFPNQYYGNDIYGLSMGDTGMADTYRLNTGFGNPALIARTKNAVFSTGVMFGYTNYKDDTNKKFRDNSLDFPYFNMVIPISNHKLGFQFQSLSSGIVNDQRTITPADTTEISYTERNAVDSYLYRVDFMYSYPYKYFDFGIALNYYLGHETHSISQDSGNSPFNTFYSLYKTYDNPGVSIGFIKKMKKMSTALTYVSAAKLTGDSELKSIQITNDLGKSEYNLPNRFSLGMTLNHNDKFRSSYEIHYDMWNAANNPENTEDSWKIGVGADYIANNNADHFLARMPLRAGLSWRRLPFLKNGNAIDEKSASIGLTLPLKNPDNRIDLGFIFSMRGDKSKNLVQENSAMFLLGITGFDIFTREHRRTEPREIPKVEEIE